MLSATQTYHKKTKNTENVLNDRFAARARCSNKNFRVREAPWLPQARHVQCQPADHKASLCSTPPKRRRPSKFSVLIYTENVPATHVELSRHKIKSAPPDCSQLSPRHLECVASSVTEGCNFQLSKWSMEFQRNHTWIPLLIFASKILFLYQTAKLFALRKMELHGVCPAQRPGRKAESLVPDGSVELEDLKSNFKIYNLYKNNFKAFDSAFTLCPPLLFSQSTNLSHCQVHLLVAPGDCDQTWLSLALLLWSKQMRTVWWLPTVHTLLDVNFSTRWASAWAVESKHISSIARRMGILDLNVSDDILECCAAMPWMSLDKLRGTGIVRLASVLRLVLLGVPVETWQVICGNLRSCQAPWWSCHLFPLGHCEELQASSLCEFPKDHAKEKNKALRSQLFRASNDFYLQKCKVCFWPLWPLLPLAGAPCWDTSAVPSTWRIQSLALGQQ